MPPVKLLYILLTALMTSLLILPYLYPLAIKIGGIDLPDNHRKVHTSATPRLGGIAMLVGLMISVIVYCPPSPLILGITAGAAIIFLLGFVDDLQQLSSSQKLIGQIVGVAVGVLLGDNYLTNLGDLFGFGQINFPPVIGIPFTIICIVGVVNALNMIDGLDGLAGSIAALASMAFALIAYSSGNQPVMFICVALFGAVLGFLTHNSYPARIFMGDGGSNMLGFTLGMMAVALASSSDKVSPVTPLIILAVPILDTVYVMASRMCKQKAVMGADRAHLHHRLLDMGLSHRATVIAIVCCSSFMAGIAVLANNAPDHFLMTFVAVGTVLFYSTLHAASRYFPPRPSTVSDECAEPSLDTGN